MIRIFGDLKQLGWRPLRTIEFASFDAEEYNLVGSTEHVENRVDELRRNGFAYVNVDAAVKGSSFIAAASPLFERVLLRVLDRTSDPVANKTLRSLWDEEYEKLEGLGAGSDYVPFQDIAGTSSIDLGFTGGPYPYHSCYDNFKWMEEQGDPGFQYHKLLGQVWALLILELADRPVLPFDLEAYADAVKGYVHDLDQYVNSKGSALVDLGPLYIAADVLAQDAHLFHEWDRLWTQEVFGSDGYETNVMTIKRISHNTKMANFETDLLDVEGGVSSFFLSTLSSLQAWILDTQD